MRGATQSLPGRGLVDGVGEVARQARGARREGRSERQDDWWQRSEAMLVTDVFGVGALLRELALEDAALAGSGAPMREARAFAWVLEHLPIGLVEGESLAGDAGWDYAEEALQARMRGVLERPAGPAGEPTARQLLDWQYHCTACYTTAHTLVDYERVIHEGLAGVLEEVWARQAMAEGEALEYLHAMEVALEAVGALAGRYAGLAREQAALAEGEERERLERIAAACERVPWEPARSVQEALQAIWLTHLVTGISEYSGASLSLGRLDQYLYPLYCQDLAAGVPAEALRGLLADLWRKLNRYGDAACAVNLGGVGPDGADLLNPLSEVLIGLSRELQTASPILAARVHPGMPTEVFDALLDPALLRMGQPTFYGEEPCREALRRRGVPVEELHRFAANSCMGLVIPGEEISDMWGVVVNVLLPLELALNGGRPFRGELPVALSTPPRDSYASLDDLYGQFARYLDELVGHMVAYNAADTEWYARERPNPFLSALTRDCVARGLDRAGGGARYHCVIVEGFGWGNAADALTAVGQLCFDEGSVSLTELVAAAQANYEGFECLRQRLLGAPKYGSANGRADEMAARVTATFAAAVRGHADGRRWLLPSYHTLIVHIWAGAKLGASLDGRRAGEPLNKNAGPMPGRARAGLTGVLLSASALPQAELSGGQALDVSVQLDTLATEAGKRAFEALLQTYFARGGLQVQVNGLSPEELRAAIAEPQAHRDLTVRIAGYSAPFVSLAPEVQVEMVERLENGL